MPEAFPPLSPEYDRFLYAVICNEANGTELTMASAIARSGADPWREAALIAKMPEDVALRVLAGFMPDAADSRSNSNSGRPTVESLFALLPARSRLVAPLARSVGNTELIVAALLIVLCAAFVLAPLFAAKSTESGTPDAPAPAPVSETVR